MNSIRYDDIRQAMTTLGISNEMVCVHSSLKSFGQLEGGADTLIRAFSETHNTMLVPTFSYNFYVPPPADMRPLQNGCDYSSLLESFSETSGIYTPQCHDISPDMGVVPKAVLGCAERVRGNHPTNSFAAIGPKARHLIERQTPLQVYAPFETMYQEGGWLMLMGVGLTRATAIHYAEQRAGKHLFVRWAYDADGKIQKTREGSCSEGFEQLASAVALIEQTLTVGASLWRIYPFREFVDLIAAAIQADPMITHCDDEQCLRCRDMVKGGCLEA